MPRRPGVGDHYAPPLVTDTRYVGWLRPAGWEIVTLDGCRGCGASIAWALTIAGKYAPLDPSGTNHFATCPQADRFRRNVRGPRGPRAV